MNPTRIPFTVLPTSSELARDIAMLAEAAELQRELAEELRAIRDKLGFPEMPSSRGARPPAGSR